MAFAFRGFEKYFSVFKIELIDFFQSKWDVIFGFLFLGVIIFVYQQLWTLGLAQKTIPGYNLAKIIFYVAIAESLTVSAVRIYKTIDDEIKKGLVANYLSKPVNYVFFQFSRALGKSLITFLINLVLALIFCFLLIGVFPIGPLELLATLIVCFAGLCLLTISGVFFGLLGFFTEDSSAFYFLYSKATMIFGGLVFPIDLYPAWLKAISDFLPFKWAVWVGGKIAVSFSPSLFFEALAMQALWVLLFAILCLLVFKKISKNIFVHGG